MLLVCLLVGCSKEEHIQDLSSTPFDNERITTSRGRVPLPSVFSDMLRFRSLSHFNSYLEYIAELSDRERNALEARLNYTPLGTALSDSEARNSTFNDSPLLSVLNQYQEVRIGDQIRKHISKNIFTKGDVSQLPLFLDMRATNGIKRDGLCVYNQVTGKEIFLDQRSSHHCQFEIDVLEDADNPAQVYARIIVMDIDGNQVSNCSAQLTISWGDGNQTTREQALDERIEHTYQVACNQCRFFNMRVTLTTIFCGPCDDGIPTTYIISRQIEVCNFCPTIIFYENNNGGGDEVCEIVLPQAPSFINFRNDNLSCENDEARSAKLLNMKAGIVMMVFDDANGRQNDDYTKIEILQDFTQKTLNSFERSFSDSFISVTHIHDNGLDGKVSSFSHRN